MTDISVIIPVYNVSKYLRQCVDSVLSQRKDNIEIILVDDGSTDDSGIICDEYAEKNENIKVIHKNNGGLGSARNAGVRIAEGKYIYYLDSDDWIAENTLNSLFELAETNNLDILLFGAKCFWDGSGCYSDDYPESYRYLTGLNTVKKGVDSLCENFFGGIYFAPVYLRLYRRQYLEQLSIEFNEEIIHEDEDYGFITYFLAERVMCIEDLFYQRRYREGSIITSGRYLKSAEGRQFAFLRILQLFSEKRFEPEKNIVCLRQCEIYMHDISQMMWKTSGDSRRRIKNILLSMINAVKVYRKDVELRTKLLIYFPVMFSFVMYLRKRGKHE